MFKNIRIVLINTSHPGNIGSAARALKNMGLGRLFLVNPKAMPDAESYALAAGGGDVLDKVTICRSLLEAIKDCHVVYGSGSDLRDEPWPVMDAREAAEKIIIENEEKEIAIVFGRESSGMTNDEMKHCHYQIQMLGGSDYCSLNLAQAVQVMTYELRMAHHLQVKLKDPKAKHSTQADVGDLESVYERIEETLVHLNALNPKRPGQLMNRVRKVLNNAELEKKDVEILYGVLKHLK